VKHTTKKFNLVVILSRSGRCRSGERVVHQKGDPENQPEGRSLSDSTGKEDQAQGNPFAKSLPTAVDRMHDDHYHVDFGIQ